MTLQESIFNIVFERSSMQFEWPHENQTLGSVNFVLLKALLFKLFLGFFLFLVALEF